jgi:non-ribosomal peptide synthase protein (TIGR01720 family)
VSFNYLGQIDGALEGAGGSDGSASGGMFAWAKESAGPAHSLHANRAHPIVVNAQISGGRLEVEFTYSESTYRRATIEALASRYGEALSGIIAHCRSAETGGYTPSDFPDVNLDQEKLDRLMSKVSRANRGTGRRT